jgi:lipoprotein signal peptidase
VAVAAAVFVEHLVLARGLASDSVLQHARSPLWAIGVVCGLALVLGLRNLTAGSWLLVGGALGNLLSWLGDGKIPDYLTLTVADRWIAFNLADASILAGMLAMILAALMRATAQVRRRALA